MAFLSGSFYRWNGPLRTSVCLAYGKLLTCSRKEGEVQDCLTVICHKAVMPGEGGEEPLITARPAWDKASA